MEFSAFFPDFFAFAQRAFATRDNFLFASALSVRFLRPLRDSTWSARLVPVRALIAATTRSRCCVNSTMIWLVSIGGAYKVGHRHILGLPVAAYLTWQERMLENNGIVPKFQSSFIHSLSLAVRLRQGPIRVGLRSFPSIVERKLPPHDSMRRNAHAGRRT